MQGPEQSMISTYLEELEKLAKARTENEERTRRIDKAVRAMIDLVDDQAEREQLLTKLDDVVRPVGLTDAIRNALKANSPKPLTPKEVRSLVGMHLRDQSNPLASVHTVLKRLAATEHVEAIEKDGETAYKWADASRLMEQIRQRRARPVITQSIIRQVVPSIQNIKK
jgi:hypothetical protein